MESAKESAKFENSPQSGSVDIAYAESVKENVRSEYSSQRKRTDNTNVKSVQESQRLQVQYSSQCRSINLYIRIRIGSRGRFVQIQIIRYKFHFKKFPETQTIVVF